VQKKPGGVFFIIDFLPHLKVDHPAAHTVAHNGFDKGKVNEIFSNAGLVDFQFVQMGETVKMRDSSRTPFLARGKLAAKS
jgi:hypothetical protein